MGKFGAVFVALVTFLSTTALAAPQEFEILYSERTSQFDGSASLVEGESKAFRFIVSQANVTSIDFVLTWKETGDPVRLSKMDTFSLSITPPDGSATRYPTERANDGDIHVQAGRLNRLPDGGPASAAEVDEILDSNVGREGIGEWRAIVHLEDVGNPEGAKVDEGNDFTLTVYVRFYEGVPLRVVTLSKPSSIQMAGEADLWFWAVAGLAMVATFLATLLVISEIRKRRAGRRRILSPRPVTPRVDDSLEGETRLLPDR